jgi:TldD protein
LKKTPFNGVFFVNLRKLMDSKEFEKLLETGLKESAAWEFLPRQVFFDYFGLNEPKLLNIIDAALSRGGDYGDVYLEYTVSNSIVMDEDTVKAAGQSITMGAGIRTVKGDQTGYAHSETLETDLLLEAAGKAAAIAGEKDTGIRNPDLKADNGFTNFYPVKNPALNMATARRVDLLRGINRVAREEDKRVAQVSVTLTDNLSLILIANSEGDLLWDVRPMLRLGVNVILNDGSRYETANAGGGGRIGLEYFDLHSGEEHAREAVRQAGILMEAENAPAGAFPVILKAAQSGILLHEAIGHPLEADFNRKNTSAYAGRIGEMVASPLCTIIDDGTVINDRGSINFDDEGIPARKNVLIKDGKLVSYMHDRISAKYYGVKPTGNGRRESFQYFPIPRMTTTYMENGDSDPEEIIQSVEEGIYCCTFRGGQVDISNGDFVFVPVEAYWIEKGKIKHPVKNLTLIGNGPEALTRVSMVGNDFAFSDGMWTCGKGQTVPVGIGLPTVKIDEMTVGGQ